MEYFLFLLVSIASIGLIWEAYTLIAIILGIINIKLCKNIEDAEIKKNYKIQAIIMITIQIIIKIICWKIGGILSFNLFDIKTLITAYIPILIQVAIPIITIIHYKDIRKQINKNNFNNRIYQDKK